MAFSVLNLSSLNGSNGFAINGIASRDGSGSSVSNAGDINDDGIDDLIIGAPFASANNSNSGQSYVVFGRSTGFSSSLNLSSLNGSNGFAINGISAYDSSGDSVSSAGDVNGDGIDDLIISAPFANPNGKSNSGQSYVVFGRSTGFSSSFNLSSLNGSNGFAINGVAAFDGFLGSSVSSAGDVNGDGIGDLIIGALGASPNGIGSGQSYVVFGRSTGFGSSLNLSSLNGSNGFTINGIAVNDRSGSSVSSAGDVNGDGIDDLIIGANGASPNGIGSGQSYVVYGFIDGLTLTRPLADASGVTRGGIIANLTNGTLQVPNPALNASFKKTVLVPAYLNVTGTAFADTLTGSAGNNVLVGNAGNDFLNGRAGDDTLIGGTGNDTLDGGTGSDTVNYSSLDAGITLKPTGVLSKISAAASSTTDQLIAVETIIADADFLSANTIDASSATGTATLNANLSTNNLVVNISPTRSLSFKVKNFANVIGTASNDSLIGSNSNNRLNGGNGNDTIAGALGNDTLNGGEG
jgi:hypothetical protein